MSNSSKAKKKLKLMFEYKYTGWIDAKLPQVTRAALIVFGGVPDAFEFWVSEVPSQKYLKHDGKVKLYI